MAAPPASEEATAPRPAGDGSVTAGSAPPPAGRSAAARRPRGHGKRWHVLAKRRWQLSGFLAVIMLIAAAAGVALALSRHPPASPGASRHRGSDSASQTLSAAAATRARAVSWVLQQVSTGTIVSCDSLVCMALASHGYPASNLLELGPKTPNPDGSAVVIATPAVRSEYGSRLESDYAPEILASFGTASSRIDIRVVASGLTPYPVQLAADVSARARSGAELLRNRNVTASATAVSQLRAGQVDARLLATLVQLARMQPIDIVAFGDSGPGASAGMPLRSVDLAQTARGAHATGTAYLKLVQSFLDAQNEVYRAARVGPASLAGQAVLQIQFDAPEPLGLLGQPGP